DASYAFGRYLMGENTSNMLELSYYDRKRIHNLKYYTWIEQQGKTSEELNAQWYDRNYWTEIAAQKDEIDTLIKSFNEQVGLL
ncbi:MAG TPA: pyridoxal-5-phosphate-dependent protein subunit beta, partial [Flexilinea sp.]|nr:pyridoxal-5-phosphate-dependent protein subunit beta [Flexilinea sp.]